jgi:immune inhibitor A
LLGLTLTVGLAAGAGQIAVAKPGDPSASAVTGRGDEGPLVQKAAGKANRDELSNPEESKRRELRERALKMVLSGKVKPITRNGSTVVKIGTKKASYNRKQLAQLRAGQQVQAKTVDQYVELSREKTDKIFVVLTEFGNERGTDINAGYGDRDTAPAIPGPATFEGPLHNRIPAPDRTVDNSTIWQADYSADYYRKLYFGTGAGVESLKTYYERQSSGRYSVDGTVTDWVKVKYNEARYGRSDGFPCASNVCSNTWDLIRDGINQWVADQTAKGVSAAEIKSALSSYDEWDRNDYDGDGDFNEPDGYVDHFQIVHAGGDQADGDPSQGEDAIWSHRWKAFQSNSQGPTNNLDGGTQIGSTGLWVADYTIQPENGGLSVFAHEYGHDLGLPDLYDTSGGGGSNVEWWSLMAQSRLSAAGDQGIGTRPGDLGAWEKLQLGWLDYEVARAGQQKTFDMGPHEYNSDKAQGLVVVLPKKKIVTELGQPFAGSKSWYSGAGDNLNASMSRTVTLPAGSATLSFQTRYDIEDCGPDPCDYAYVEVDAGQGWKAIAGNITKAAEGNGMDGTAATWTPASFDLSAYAGQTIGLRVRYSTDGAAQGNSTTAVDGIFVDEISLVAGGQTLLSDGAETSPNGWTLNGFTAVGSSTTEEFDHYYIASNRQYVSYDEYLRTGPYNFGFVSTRPDFVEHFPYQDGLLISYWDTSQTDNNTSAHPGAGEILTIDAHPAPIVRLDGQFWRSRVALYDATFSRERADSITLHNNGKPSYIRGQAAQPLFDDTRKFWYEETPLTGVKTAKAGVTLRVVEQQGTSMRVRLGVTPTAAAVAAR